MQQESGSKSKTCNKKMRGLAKERIPMKKWENNKNNNSHKTHQVSVNKVNTFQVKESR